MKKIKIKDKRNGAIKFVEENVVGTFVGTGRFEVVKDNKKTIVAPINKEEK